MGRAEIRKVLNSIEADEVRTGAEDAVTLMNSAERPDERKAAKQTYVALARFGSHLRDHFVKPRFHDPSEAENKQESLKTAIRESGIAYLGPMFKSGGLGTPLTERKLILKEMATRGYHTAPLAHLTDEQLDMLYTKTLESGLLSDFTNAQPVLGE
jgi:hypothetical protein